MSCGVTLRAPLGLKESPGFCGTGQPALYAEVSDTLLPAFAEDGAHLAALRRIHLASLIIVPLLARGRLERSRLHRSVRPGAFLPYVANTAASPPDRPALGAHAAPAIRGMSRLLPGELFRCCPRNSS